MQAGVDLATGGAPVWDTHIALPTEGMVPWRVGISYSAAQKDSGHHDSDGYQGRNMFQISQPELVLYEHVSDDAEDVLYLVYGADRFAEFKRLDSSSDLFRGVNGTAGVIEHEAGSGSEPDTYTYTDLRGVETVFFGFDADASPADGQLWKITDPASNTAYVGNSSTASTAISSGYDSNGRMTTAYDTSGRRYSYSYTSLDGISRLTQVLAEENNDATWGAAGTEIEVAKVAYAYYQTGGTTYGGIGCLKQVTVTRQLSDAGIEVDLRTYYRYWTGSFDDTNNPGHAYSIQYIVEPEGVRQYDWSDSAFDGDHLVATEGSLKAYASAYFEQNSSREVDKTWRNGECGCSGASNGSYEITYESNGSHSATSGYDSDWLVRGVVKRPDGAYVSQYLDEVGQGLSRVLSDADPSGSSSDWVTEVLRNSSGLVSEIRTPAANATYTHSTGLTTANASSGLIRTFERETASVHTKDFLIHRKHQVGTGGTAYYDSSLTYAGDSGANTYKITIGSGGDTVDLYRPSVISTHAYEGQATTAYSGDLVTDVGQTAYSGGLHTEGGEQEPEQVPASENGQAADYQSFQHFRTDGTLDFAESEIGIVSYAEYVNGQVVKRIEDADTSLTGAGEDFNGIAIPTSPTNFASDGSGDEEHRKTVYTYDAQGRQETVERSSGTSAAIKTRSYYSKLADGRLVSISIPREWNNGGTTTYDGPASYRVMNQRGQIEFAGTIVLSGNSSTTALSSWIDETDDDPITAVDHGSLFRVSSSVYNETGGTLTETRSYFDIPASGSGTEGMHYDATEYVYDNMGRRIGVKSPTGTIRQTVYDDIGRAEAQYVGTNDNSVTFETTFESSGTSDMVKVSETVYDTGGVGNGLVTKSTAFVIDGTTDRRDTEYTYDDRGRRVLTKSPQSPHTFVKLDNLGRAVAVGQYSSTASIVVGTDDPTTETTNRLGLSETFYDDTGRVWKEKRHKIKASDGTSTVSLTTLHWYDEMGRRVKTKGNQLTKTVYDRLGRVEKTATLGGINDAEGTVQAWTDAQSASGDVVIEESQIVYELDGDDVLMRVTIQRHHDDYGSGEATDYLDSGADSDRLKLTAANVEGRAQITAMWYDDLGRLTDTVRYGTYNGADFDRDGLSVPARSDTALRTTIAYNDNGMRQSVTDPMDIETRYEYDDAGRQIAVISNYVNGTPSSSTGDDDNYVRYVYSDGQRTKMWVDLDGDNVEDSDDQVTVYTYGVTKGAGATDSEIGSGDLLYTVQYPDSSGGSDVVTYAYNAQRQQVYMKDQAGNVIETTYDTAGRETERSVTTLASGFNGDVRRIETAYTDRAQAETITQYDAATSGSVVNEVKYTYDDWGPVSKIEQDRDSAVGANAYDVDFSWSPSTPSGGRQTVRLEDMTLPDGTLVDYTYLSIFQSISGDSQMSRVTQVKVGATVVADYDYLGLNTVARTDIPEPDFYKTLAGTTSGSYPNLDRFNRVTSDVWVKDLSTDVDFIDLDIAYDRNSNITSIDDQIHQDGSSNGVFDYGYAMDDLNRLTQAERGNWTGSAINTLQTDELWTLSQSGNWELHKLDLNGDTDFTDPGELFDDQTFNQANELTARDTDDDGTDDYTLTYDAVGNLTDDAEHHKYVYDAFGRLMQVKNQSDAVVSEYEYYGTGWRSKAINDSDADGSMADETPRWFAYDHRWRIVATYDGSAAIDEPTEQLVYHNAGLDGQGSGSYIDSVILRDRDTTGGSPHALDERVYYLQNWRADVVALVSDAATQIEQVRYSAYGVPYNLPAGDVLSTYGSADFTDYLQLATWYGASSYDARGDLDLDGDIDASDLSAFTTNTSGGRGVLSLSGNDSRKGYAGYELDPDLQGSKWHVRHRVLDSESGRWLRRDPLLILLDNSLYRYVDSRPITRRDKLGLFPTHTGPSGGGNIGGGGAKGVGGFVGGSGDDVCLARIPGESMDPNWPETTGNHDSPDQSISPSGSGARGDDFDWEELLNFFNSLLGNAPGSGYGLPSFGLAILDGAPDWFKIQIAAIFEEYAVDFYADNPNGNPDRDPTYVWLETWASWAGETGQIKEVCCAVRCLNPAYPPNTHGPRVDCTICSVTVPNLACCKRIDPTKSNNNPTGNPNWGPVTPVVPPDRVTQLVPYRPPL
ncbi:MAG: hypothetical protein ED559_07700 [Phycisphaera sp.]|nr:MAG: hypothetical protein ED559_07700 [Phycisphaera sp.]